MKGKEMKKHNPQGDFNAEAVSLGTEVWNVADGFTKIKILKHLVLLDKYDTVAQFGTEEMDQDQFMTQNQLALRRIDAIKRFHSTLKQLIGNVLFALGSAKIESTEGFQDRLRSIEDVLDYLYSNNENQITHETTIEINEKLFKIVLEILQKIKDELNFPMNEASLIFRASDEFDLDALQSAIEQGG